MSDVQQPPQNNQNTQLTDDKDWDRHNKRAEKAAQVFQEHITQGSKRKRSQKGKKKWLVIVLVLALVAVAGAATYWFALRSDGGQEKSTEQSTENTVESQSSSLSSDKTKTYDSSRFFLSFQYPDTWKVDESDPNALTVVSPQVALQSAGGLEVQGKVTMTIRPKNSQLAEFKSGDAFATKQSELITYTKPTQAQRASTYLTFAAFSEGVEGVDTLYITGDYGYQVGQAVLQTEISQIDPIISVTFGQCVGAGCVNVEPMTLSLKQWGDANFSSSIKAMLQSIAIQ